MSRVTWHRSLVTIVIVLLVAMAAFYAISILLAPSGGRHVAGLFDGWAMFSLLGAIAVGIADFFVRPLGGRSGETRSVGDDRVTAATHRTAH